MVRLDWDAEEDPTWIAGREGQESVGHVIAPRLERRKQVGRSTCKAAANSKVSTSHARHWAGSLRPRL